MFTKVVLRGAFGYDPDVVSLDTGLAPGEDGMTQQHFAKECDITEIVRRFGLTGELPQGIGMPLSGEFEEVTDFHSAMNVMRKAQESFLLLPADVRRRFGDDPGAVVRFLDDPANREEAIALGIVAKPPEVTRDVVQAVDELAAAVKAKGID